MVSHYLDFSGSSTFLQTLACFFRSKGLEVIVFGIVVDARVARHLSKEGITVVADLKRIKKNKIDCIVAQHNIPTMMSRYIFPNIPIVFISHGVLSPTELPPSIYVNISHYFAISEEVQNNLVKKAGIPISDITIIRNVIDPERFKIQKPIRQKPQKVLFISSRYTQNTFNLLRRACDSLGLSVSILGKKEKKYSVEKEINSADIVVSLGRGALEAMSCGRQVLIYDYQGGDGMVSEKNFLKLMKKNFSGRCTKRKYKIQDLKAELKKYDFKSSEILRSIVLRHFNVNVEGEKLLSIISKIQPRMDTKLVQIPYEELGWLIKRIDLFARRLQP